MKKIIPIILLLFFSGCAVFSPLQRGNLIGVYNLIEKEEFEEAKEIIEGMVEGKESSQWPRTWYARGVLSLKAYQTGKEKNNKEMYELYPDQLYVAVESFEKARKLSSGSRFNRRLASHYTILANYFSEMGTEHFQKGEFKKAIRSFEQALAIKNTPVLEDDDINDLKYNAALASFEGKKWANAIDYLEKLHETRYSANAAHLLFKAHIENNNKYSAEKVLRESIEKYDDNRDLILVLVDFLFDNESENEALAILEQVTDEDEPESYIFFYTKGLINQKTENYKEAIEAYKEAVALNPEHIDSHLNIANSYFNIGVDIEQEALTIVSNIEAEKQKEKSDAAFSSAVSWLDKIYDRMPDDQAIQLRIYELYRALGITQKARNIQHNLINGTL